MDNLLLTSLICLIILIVIIYVVYSKESFISGYGYINFPRKTTCIIPLNEVSKSTDFNLYSLVSQLKYQIIKPKNKLINTNTEKGIISETSSENANVILFPGLGDYILKQNSKEVWPRNSENLKDYKYTEINNNNSGHFNSITTLLESLNYKEGSKLNTILYDFRDFNIDNVFKQFKSLLTKNTVIISYDFGCTMANLCINSLESKEKEMISKFLLICPTIGGIPMAIREYFSYDKYKSFMGLLMSLPNEQFYKKPVVIYNSISYNCNNIPTLMNEIDLHGKNQDKYLVCKKYQEMSFKNSGVDCIIVANGQFNTPVSYNYKNNLNGKPETYLPENNTLAPSNIPQKTLEGLQDLGDSVVPISSINKLRELWKDNCNIELIRDKDHFTILKSYELGLIITSII